MIRFTRLSLTAFVVGALLAPATAQATPPATGEPTLIPAGVVCDFDVLVTFTGTTHSQSVDNNPRWQQILASPGFVPTIANAEDPSKSVTLNGTGLFRFSTHSDGTSTLFATGHNLLFYPEIGFTLTATTGPVEVHLDADGLATSVDLSRASHVVDVCSLID
jgi:hypothetical protein